MKVWAIESCMNDYNCGYELAKLFRAKPSIYEVAATIFEGATLETLEDDQIINVVQVARGDEVRIANYDWHLIQIDVVDNHAKS